MSPEREGREEVSLRRLSAVAPLGPGPVVAVARAVLGRLAELHLGGRVHGGVDPGAVLVGGDGRVRLAGEGSRPVLTPAAIAALQDEEVAAAWRLAAGLLAGSVVTAPAPLRELLAGPVPAGGAHAALSALGTAAGELAAPSGERRAAARLAELAGPLRRYRHGPPQPTVGGLGAATVITAGRPPPPARAAPPARRRHPWRIAVAGAAAVTATATAFLVARGSSGPVPPSTAAIAAATPLPGLPPPPPIPAAPAMAPARAGVIAGVRLATTAGPCVVATVCSLRVGVDLLPHRSATTLRVVVELVDRCTGVHSTVALPLRRVTAAAAAAGWVARLRVPAGPAPALIVVVLAPARAASAPLLVAPYLPTC